MAVSLKIPEWLEPHSPLPEFGSSFIGMGALAKAYVASTIQKKVFHPQLYVFAEKSEAHSFVENVSFFSGSEEKVHYIPPYDFDFYKGLLPNPDALAERNHSLQLALKDPSKRIFATTIGSLLQKVMPKQSFETSLITLALNDEIDRDQLIVKLLSMGYRRLPVAYDPGVFSVRGGLMDIFSPNHSSPIRIDFYGDLIEQIRFYDPETQRSLDAAEMFSILPLSQYVIPDGERLEAAVLRVKQRLDALEVAKSERDGLIEEIRNRNVVSPFLFSTVEGGSCSLVDYFPEDTVFVWDSKASIIQSANEKEIPRLSKNVELFEQEPTPISPANELFLSEGELTQLIERPRFYQFESFESEASQTGLRFINDKLSLENERLASRQKDASQPILEEFAKRFRLWMNDGYQIHVICHTHTHGDRIRLLFEPYGLKVISHPEGESGGVALFTGEMEHIHLWQGAISESAVFEQLRAVVLSEEEIFGQKRRTAKKKTWAKKSPAGKKLKSFRQLKEGDYVVHKEQGIGRYLGLRSMNFLGVPNDYVLIEYRDGDKLYVPSYRLSLIQKYVGGDGGGHVVLDKMGGDRWTKAKKKAAKAAQELAGELLNIQAQRKLVPAQALTDPGNEFRKFEMEFPFDETPDQMRAIEETMASLNKSYPMDRLVVGDVGYGKTEVAMRAAYLAALAGKQSCVVVPTTVLAFQHFESFQERFKNTPVRIQMVSRMRKPSQNKKVLEELKAGKIDVIVGTHRLFSSDVVFRDLALVVVDEEHRFGVVHKEKLKKLAKAVHFLSMTATPIPRTLNMAMTGIKDISLITTPPPDRMAVRTFVCRRSDEVIVEAISNELVRDGQVFFLHNRVETIQNVANDLKELLPKAKFEVVHGQMDGKTLEKKMLGFYHGDFQVLVTTAIIESGLDVPRANTIIIDRADRLGLAQLYQLRGRVGRSEKRAFCYLLVPPEQELTKDAKQRLQVIQRYSDLGAGFNVASYDLEIRGAGDLLGKEQSGQIHAVGVDMYFELLEESVRYLQGEAKKIDIEPEISLKLAAYFPDDYLPDVSERVNLYRQLSGVEDEDAVSEIEEEIRDRFGSLPEEVKNLLGLMRIKLYLKKMHVTHMNCGPKKASLLFAKSTPITGEQIVDLIKSHPKIYSVTPDNKLVFAIEEADWKPLLAAVQKLSDLLLV